MNIRLYISGKIYSNFKPTVLKICRAGIILIIVTIFYNDYYIEYTRSSKKMTKRKNNEINEI